MRTEPRPVEHVVGTWSPSRHDMALRCPFAFAQRYVWGEKVQPTAAQAFGNAFDETTNRLALDKRLSGENQPEQKATDLFRTEWRIQSEKVEHWHPGEDVREMTDQGAKLASLWNGALLDHLQVHLVQPEIALQCRGRDGDTFRVVGRLDLVGTLTDRGGNQADLVIDQKAAAKRWNTRKAIENSAAPIYVRAMRDQYPRVRSALFVIALRYAKPVLQAIERPVDPSEPDHVLARFDSARHLVRAMYSADAFPPNRTNFLCSRRWCAWWQRCESTWGGRVPD